MRVTPVLTTLACAVIFFAGLAAAAAAGGAGPSADAPQKPSADSGTTGQPDCLDETGDYQTHGKIITYVIGLENKCDKRMKCEIFANVTGVKGSTLGHATMILDGKSSGAAAKQSYAMKVKAFGGTAQVSRECRKF